MAKASVTVRLKDLDKLFANVRRVEDLQPLRNLLLDAAATARTTAVAAAPSFSGKLHGSFVTDIEPLSARVSTPLDYARIMEFGRKPNADKMPPPRALDTWAKSHGITNTYALAKSIQKRGLKGRFFRRKARAAVRKQLPALLDRMSRQMEAGWR